MSRARLLLSLLGLAIAVVLVQLGIGWMQVPTRAPEKMGPPRSGYTLKNFSLSSYGANGQLSLRMQAPSLQRRENDHSLFIDKPRFVVPVQGKTPTPPWRGHSEYAWIQADGNWVRLLGKVDMQREGIGSQPATHIHTSDLDYWPPRQQAATSQPARMQQGPTRMNGIGLRLDLTTQHLELLHDVHGTFAPSPRH